MREIMFRGKTKCKNEWAYGFYCVFDGVDYILLNSGGDYCDGYNGNLDIEGCPANSMIEVLPETVGQYTGLKDKNVQMIFEGDVIEFFEVSGFGDGMAVVFYLTNEACFYIQNDTADIYDMLYAVNGHEIVIGNIHDNPTLLEV